MVTAKNTGCLSHSCSAFIFNKPMFLNRIFSPIFVVSCLKEDTAPNAFITFLFFQANNFLFTFNKLDNLYDFPFVCCLIFQHIRAAPVPPVFDDTHVFFKENCF